MSGVDDIIKQWVQDAERSGEIRRLPGFGEPFDFDDGFLETPIELRTAYKVLKNAGYVPAEIELRQRIAALRERLNLTADADECDAIKREIAEHELKAAIMLDSLRGRR